VNFEVTILGCGAATPTLRHHPTGQVVNLHDKYFLVDCGEGIQMQLRRYKIKMQRIDHIFISHLHGDHYFGIQGLLSSMHLLGRKKTLHLFAPEGLKEIIDVFQRVGEMFLSFPIEFHTLDVSKPEVIFEDNSLEVVAFPLEHRITCAGFIFREKERKPKVSQSVIQQLQLTVEEIVALKNRRDIPRADGSFIEWRKWADMPAPVRAYAFCSDTKFSNKVISAVHGVDLLYHEATFLHEMKLRAQQTHHSTALEAGRVAREAKVHRLIIGHFSARYLDESVLLLEAQAEFPQTRLAAEGVTFHVEAKPALPLL
jgi:ribonuclease Z